MLRKILKQTVAQNLTWLAQLIIRKYRPKIIAISGSVGKTSTKEAIRTLLAENFRVRASQKSFNSEIGLPLSIIGADNPWWNPWGWFKVFLKGLALIFFKNEYPAVLILEAGVDRPGDMRRLLKWLKTDTAVITHLPAIPAHIEFFVSPQELAVEKLLLLKTVKADGVAVINYDDSLLKTDLPHLKDPDRILTYGFNEGATMRGSHERVIYNEKKKVKGMSFKINYKGNSVPFRIRGVIGRHLLYNVLAAAAVGVSWKLNLVELSRLSEKINFPAGRMKIIAGVKQTTIIDDSYNSSPAALQEALAALQTVETDGRKIAVLGDMLELGQYTIDSHTEAGKLAAETADIVIAIGIRAKFIYEQAIQKLGPAKTFHFFDAAGAGKHLEQMLKPNDLVLVKGSQAMRLERLVEEIMAEPERKKELLCRQDPEWLRR